MALTVVVCPATSYGQFKLTLGLFGLTEAQETVFDEAATLWDDLILGYQTGINLSGITITAGAADLGGVGGTLASAGVQSTTTRGGFVFASRGHITIDTHDIGNLESNGRLLSVIAHEIGHILGIGSLWTANDVYVNGSGQYTGEFGVAAFQEEFNTRRTSIPVELDGGPGTANAHWDESFSFRTDDGEPLASELMSGFLNGSAFLSQTSIQSLRDLGYDVVDPDLVVEVIAGDLDGNGLVDAFDIDDFELLLADRDVYLAQFPDAQPEIVADLDGNGAIDAFDVDDFEALLAVPSTSVPTPGSAVLLAATGVLGVLSRRRW